MAGILGVKVLILFSFFGKLYGMERLATPARTCLPLILKEGAPELDTKALERAIHVFPRDPEPFFSILFQLTSPHALSFLLPWKGKIEDAVARFPMEKGQILISSIQAQMAPSGARDEFERQIFYFQPLAFWFSLQASAAHPDVLEWLWEFMERTEENSALLHADDIQKREFAEAVWLDLLLHPHWKEKETWLIERTLKFPTSWNHLIQEGFIRRVVVPQKWHQDLRHRRTVAHLFHFGNEVVARAFIEGILSDEYWIDPAVPEIHRRIAVSWVEHLVGEGNSNKLMHLFRNVFHKRAWGDFPQFRRWVVQSFGAVGEAPFLFREVLPHLAQAEHYFKVPLISGLIREVFEKGGRLKGFELWDDWEKVFQQGPGSLLPNAQQWLQAHRQALQQLRKQVSQLNSPKAAEPSEGLLEGKAP